MSDMYIICNIFLFFFSAGIVYFRGAHWIARCHNSVGLCVNPYIRLNPSPRNFRCCSAGGPTCVYVRLISFPFLTRLSHIPPVDFFLQVRQGPALLPVMFAKTRLLVLSIVVASQVSWLASVSRGKMFVYSRDTYFVEISWQDAYFVAARVSQKNPQS